MEALPMDEQDYNESIYPKLYKLVRKLEKRGVSMDMLKQNAREMGLSDCSYGGQSWVAPVTGFAWGIIGGLAASYACDGLCDSLHVEITKRVTLDIVSLALPAFYCSTAFGRSEREQKDLEFYKRLKEVYKDKLSS